MLRKSMLAWVVAGLCSLTTVSTHAATYTLNVSLSTSAVFPAQLQSEILGSLTTGQYIGTSVASPYFPNTFSVTVKSKNPAYQAPSVSTTLINLDTIANKLVDASSYSYHAAFANGMYYERGNDLAALGYIKTTYCVPGLLFKGVAIDSVTCNNMLGFANDWIVSQTSGIAVVP